MSKSSCSCSINQRVNISKKVVTELFAILLLILLGNNWAINSRYSHPTLRKSLLYIYPAGFPAGREIRRGDKPESGEIVANSGNLGNDRVDQLAKEATCQDMNLVMSVPLSHWKHVAWERTVSSWNTEFLASPTALGTKRRVGGRGRSQCITSRQDRQIVRMAVKDRSVTLRTVAQHIESVTHHSVSARTIRRRLQQSGLSARRPFLGLPLPQNHRRLHRQWCDERRMWETELNEVVFTDESRTCLQHHDGRIRVWRHRGERMLNICFMHRHTDPAPGIMVWCGIGYHSRIPLVRIAGTLNSQRYISEVLESVVFPYLQGLVTAIFQQNNARPHVARIVQRYFVNPKIELLP
ncbi:transposable element Tcb1 transposase [Trichonephila clavipes]|nr:transposable element Tcb1 transposase [Trichonephila clavipes]